MHGESIDRRRFGSRKGIEAAVGEISIRTEWEFGTGGETENAGVSVVDEGVPLMKRRTREHSHGWISQSHNRSHCNGQIAERIKLISIQWRVISAPYV